jgi:hypothetical protein
MASHDAYASLGRKCTQDLQGEQSNSARADDENMFVRAWNVMQDGMHSNGRGFEQNGLFIAQVRWDAKELPLG